ncbi:hypothetical protein [Saliphagus sp. LR7]|uniref:phage tail fiber protein n=1 Tax=Saliphagus sp. LR7 TaxID=2282654 RepID=UPI0013004D70|nr:hypothetical protein [Saliphagus sp. LR7]
MPGLNQTAAQSAIDVIIAGGADIRLMTTSVNYDDTQTELDTKEVGTADYSAETVAQADWTTTADVPGENTTLENDVVIDFGQAENDWGTVVDVVIHDADTDEFIVADEPNDPEITIGEEVSIPAGAITYTLG